MFPPGTVIIQRNRQALPLLQRRGPQRRKSPVRTPALQRLTDEVSLNIGPGEELVGVEVLDATEVLGKGRPPTVVLDNVPSVEART